MPPLGPEVAERGGGADRCSEPPGEATHWTGAAMAKAAGISVALGAAHLGGARAAAAPLSAASSSPAIPQFAAKLRDIVGLYVDPPAHAVVLSVDEKSQIQALDRTQPGLPHEEGPRRDHDPRLQAPRHDHPVRRAQRARRHGHRPLHAAPPPPGVHPLPQRHRAPRCRPARRSTSSSTTTPPTSTPRCCAWLARHPRWTFHFTPTSCSWLNAVEGFFAKLTRRRLQARRLPLARRPAGRHQPLPRRAQPATPSRSSGPPTPTKSSPPSSEGTKR